MTRTTKHRASAQTAFCRWDPANFVLRPVPAHLIHDLMQPLNAYALAAEQLKMCLNNDSPRCAASSELASMNQVIGELEADLWFLQEFWRLGSLPQPPSLLATPLNAVLRMALNRLQKRRPNFSVSIQGENDDQYVQSSAIWLGTLLSCLFEKVIQNTRLGLNVEIHAGEHQLEIEISEMLDEGIETLVHGLDADMGAQVDHVPPGFTQHLASDIALALKCCLSFKATGVSLVLPSSSESDRQAVDQPDLNGVFGGRQIGIIETDQAFSEVLAGLFRTWGCEVFCLTSPEQIEEYIGRGNFADALFVDFELWNRHKQENSTLATHLKNATNVFVTVSRDCTTAVPVDATDCIFLPRPFSPVRLRKHMMSLFLLTE